MSEILTRAELERVGKGFDPVAARSWSINTDCYRDPKFLEIERDQIFRRTWQFLCHEEKLRERGQYVTTEIQGHSVFAIRDSSGELRAFYNVCKHRGHQLLEGEGDVRLITCPYHAWAYQLDGSLKQAPHCDFVENFDKSEVRLTAVRVEVFCHLVFVNLDPEAVPLAKQSGDLQREIMSYAPDLGSLTFGHRLTYRVEANWKAVTDNFLECYHCKVAHKDFVTLVEMDTYKVATHGIYSSHMAKAGRQQNKAYGIDDASVTDHAVWYLWPNMTLMRYPGRGNFMVWRFDPVGPEETFETFDFFFESAPPTDAELEAIKFIDDVLQPEDIGLVESVQKGMRTPAFKQGRYVVDAAGSGMSEHAVHHFHGLILQAYERACAS